MYYSSNITDLNNLLSIEKRSQMISNADSQVFNVTTSEPEDVDENNPEEPAQVDAVAKKPSPKIEIEVEKPKEPVEKKNAKLNSESKTKGKNKSKRKISKAEPPHENLEEMNAELMVDIQNMNIITSQPQIKALSGDIKSVQLYLSFPPQMQFVPSEEEIMKLIMKAMDYKYESDIPKIYI